ncbi:MAG: alanine--tRNA ligase [Candidatus Lokiarchaeota archaeon]|nr:alanine--tRNA ligase [Candidatus Lokiarchaeota archaeon]
MLTDKEQKKAFKKVASKNPEEYYPVNVLNEKGFHREQCKCGTYFWTTDQDRKVCGDPVCSGGFDVIQNNPAGNELSFIGVWEKIVEILKPRGYKPINRYPVVARWNPTTEFTIASIAAFQPYVITGEAEPPAKKLVIPQFCLRFGDIENVGITGSHCTGFVMIGQHVFVSPDEWNQSEYFRDIYDFLVDGVGLAKEEFVIHEDAWAGGGSYGPCMEFFSRGVELFNQVYTMFEQTPDGDKELDLKVLDMGLGQERVAWFSQGTPNIYEAIFPKVLKKLKEITQIDEDLDLYRRFSRYSAYLNIDEVEDIDKAWEEVGKKLNLEPSTLKEKILPMTGIYSIAEHARALLFAISDGKLPSNVGGGYNLRAIFRRAVSFADRFGWDIKLNDVAKWHAEELYDIFPEVSDHLDEVSRVLDVEYRKYYKNKKKAKKLIKKLIKDGNITEDILIQLYDSNGINPEMIIEAGKKHDIKIKKPDDFYNKVVELHEQKEQIHQTYVELSLDLPSELEDTQIEYWKDYLLLDTDGIVKYIQKTKVENKECWAVITDKTNAYPTSGGQLHDVGTMNGIKFDNVVKYRGYIVHCLSKKPDFKVGDKVKISIDKDWRIQLAAHHTATHVINAAASDVLGSHINQASAKKTFEKAHLDITHYDSLSDEEIKQIENRANEIIENDLEINSYVMPRAEAEHKYGMRLYQGGAVPGKKIRVVEIPGEDVEACGGTHMHHAGEIERIKIIRSQKVQDGIVRLEFTGGNAVTRLENEDKQILNNLTEKLGVMKSQLIPRIEELITKTKDVQKAITKGEEIDNDLLQLNSKKSTSLPVFDTIDRITDILKCTPEDIENIVDNTLENYQRLVNLAKNEDIDVDIDNDIINIKEGVNLLIKELQGFKSKEVIKISQTLLKDHQKLILLTLIPNKNGIILNALLGKELESENIIHLGKEIRHFVQKYNGKGGGRSSNFQGFVPLKDKSAINEFKDSLLTKIRNLVKAKDKD